MRILITGAGRAIGRATVVELLQRGHEVVGTARNPTMLDDIDGVTALPLDVTDEASVAACFEAAGELDALVNNAALSKHGPIESFPIDTFEAIMATNVTGALRCIQAVAPAWRERGSGIIVNVSSVQGRVSTPLEGAYASSKFALEALSETLHYELGHFGIRTVIIEPGYIAPGMKHSEEHLGSSEYDELRRQWSGTVDSVTGGAGRTSPEAAAAVIADAIEDADTPLRVPIGDDAELTLGVRSSMGDAEFEAAMRSTLGLDW